MLANTPERLTDDQVHKLCQVVDERCKSGIGIRTGQITDLKERRSGWTPPRSAADLELTLRDRAIDTGVAMGLRAALGDPDALKSIAERCGISNLDLMGTIGDGNG